MNARLSRMIKYLCAVMALFTAMPVTADGVMGRVRYSEPKVLMQRASGNQTEEAEINLPFLPGDRIWTDGLGRAEVQFEDGSLAWIDRRSHLENLPPENEEYITLGLQSGSLLLRTFSDTSLAVDTSSALISTRSPSSVRIDLRNGEARVSSFEGEAIVETRKRTQVVRAGQRAYVRNGEAGFDVSAFDVNRGDDFADWTAMRERENQRNTASARYLPDELSPYASELDDYGEWRTEPEVGYVWYPRVAEEWSPYSNGRWIWTAYGWTWVPYEQWGWATCHYGRWGFSLNLGWYWIPARIWGPAWVSWSITDGYVGWCPLGWRNRALFVTYGRYNHHRARYAWRFVRRGHFGSRSSDGRYVNHPRRSSIRAYSSTLRRPGRDLARWERPRAHAAPRRSIHNDSRRRTFAASTDGFSRRRSAVDPSGVSNATRTRVSASVVRSRRMRRNDDVGFTRNTSRRGADSSARRRETRSRESSARLGSTRDETRDRSYLSATRSRGRRGEASSRTRFGSDGDDSRSRSGSGNLSRDVSTRFFRSLTRSSERSTRSKDRSERSSRYDRSSERRERSRASSSGRRASSRSSSHSSKSSHGRSGRKRR